MPERLSEKCDNFSGKVSLGTGKGQDGHLGRSTEASGCLRRSTSGVCCTLRSNSFSESFETLVAGGNCGAPGAARGVGVS
jgi:hypothetical protein